MPIDISNETVVRFSKLPEWCEQHHGHRINRSTAHRWRTRGARGVKLETTMVGGKRITSEEALERFFARVTAIADGKVPVAVISRTAVTHAEAFLESEGI